MLIDLDLGCLSPTIVSPFRIHHFSVRSSIFFYSVCMRSNGKKGWKERRRKERKRKREKKYHLLFSFFNFSIRNIVYLLFYFYSLSYFACDYVHFKTYDLSVRILLENLFALHYWKGKKSVEKEEISQTTRISFLFFVLLYLGGICCRNQCRVHRLR